MLDQLTPATAFPHEDDPAFAELLLRYTQLHRPADENEICRRSYRFIRSKAWQVYRALDKQPHLEDLISAGNYALLLAVRRLHQKLPLAVSFRVYAMAGMKSDMYREWRRVRWGNTKDHRNRENVVGVARWALAQELGHEPTDDELEARLRKLYPHYYEDLRPVKRVNFALVGRARGGRPVIASCVRKVGNRPAPLQLHPAQMTNDPDSYEEMRGKVDPRREVDPVAVLSAREVSAVLFRGLGRADARLLRQVVRDGHAGGDQRWKNLRERLRSRRDLAELVDAA